MKRTSGGKERAVDYRGLVKRLTLPSGWKAPIELIYEDIRAHAITRDDLRDDVRGINASIDLIRRTRGGSWPSEPVTEDVDYVDLVWHECEFREGESFTYAVYDGGGQYLGCCYLYPMGRRTPLTEELIGYDVDVSWWVTPDAYDHGHYATLYNALRHWIDTAFPFGKAYYSNLEIPTPQRAAPNSPKAGAGSSDGADASKLIDERIAQLGDWRGEMLARIRRLIHEVDPEVVEEWKWMGTPVWSQAGMYALANAHKDKVKLTFHHGAALRDPGKLFNAGLGGKKWRAIDFREGDRIDEPALKALLREAVTYNTKHSVPKSRGSRAPGPRR